MSNKNFTCPTCKCPSEHPYHVSCFRKPHKNIDYRVEGKNLIFRCIDTGVDLYSGREVNINDLLEKLGINAKAAL